MNENENFWYHNYQVVQAQLVEYYERNQKAIEYIEENCIDDEFYTNLTRKEKEIMKVLDILKGSDK